MAADILGHDVQPLSLVPWIREQWGNDLEEYGETLVVSTGTNEVLKGLHFSGSLSAQITKY